MAKPERPLNLALANVQRPRWPKKSPDFGTEPLAPLPAAPLLTADEAMRLGLVSADRFTCHLSPTRVTRFLQSAAPRTLVIHAVDAEPGVPLLTYWLALHHAAAVSLIERLERDLVCEVLFAVPHDLPTRLQRILSRLQPARIVDAHYPGGNWRLMPRAARLHPARTLTIDAVAATDLIEAMTTGIAAQQRPIAIAGFEDAEVIYRLATRGQRVDEISDHPNLEAESWHVGPRLIDQLAADIQTIGDGELSFYREPHGERAASACIRCGACINICPTRCDPVALLRAFIDHPPPSAHRSKHLHHAGLDACIECGLCTAVCPADIELHHSIQQLRFRTSERAHD